MPSSSLVLIPPPYRWVWTILWVTLAAVGGLLSVVQAHRELPIVISAAAVPPEVLEVEPLPPEPAIPVTDLTDEQLCRAWRASFRSLEVATRTGSVGGFAFASGARPAADPSRYLRPA